MEGGESNRKTNRKYSLLHLVCIGSRSTVTRRETEQILKLNGIAICTDSRQPGSEHNPEVTAETHLEIQAPGGGGQEGDPE